MPNETVKKSLKKPTLFFYFHHCESCRSYHHVSGDAQLYIFILLFSALSTHWPRYITPYINDVALVRLANEVRLDNYTKRIILDPGTFPIVGNVLSWPVVACLPSCLPGITAIVLSLLLLVVVLMVKLNMFTFIVYLSTDLFA